MKISCVLYYIGNQSPYTIKPTAAILAPVPFSECKNDFILINNLQKMQTI